MGADDSFHHTSSALFPDDVLEATRQATSLSLGAILANQARNRPNAVAIVDGCRSLTYKEFHLQTNRLSHGLLAQGVRPGDRIAILSGNSL
jgi:non-ribosomal peptide synthetase component E (peptide arylation enzyme)